MRILVTGRDGQIAISVCERGAEVGHDVIALGRPSLDLGGESDDIANAIIGQRPDAIVSAAAYTAVDKAESEETAAHSVNVDGAVAVACAAKRLGVPLLHLSTDYVFDGSKASPYVESDATCPVSVYGRTKRDGENAVLASYDNVAILRTAWVYSPFGSNFLKTMLRLAADRDEIGVVSDQHGNPSCALDIADGLLAVAENLVRSDDGGLRGIFHIAGSGTVSWAGFAEAIFDASAAVGGPSARIRPIGTKDYPTPARRPSNSSLDCSKLEQVHGIRLPEWKRSTVTVVNRLLTPAEQQ